MVLRLDPELPLVWRSPQTLQVGVTPPIAILDRITRAEELLVEALRRGVSRSGMSALGSELGMAEADVERLLRRLEPALARVVPPRTGAVVLGAGPLASALAATLRDAGHAPDSGPLHLAVLVAPWLIGPADSGPWLRRDIPHLPVVVADRTVTVGPLVLPGRSACLHCLDRHRIDADPAWPGIAGQLLRRSAPALAPFALAEALALAGRTALRSLGRDPAAGVEQRLDLRTGVVSARVRAPHPECRCSAPQGSDWATADAPPPEVLGAPTRATVASVPA